MSESTFTSFSSSLFPDEQSCMQQLLEDLPWDDKRAKRVSQAALELAETLRSRPETMGPLEQFLQQFALTSDEGLALMTLAEALLRVPDARTADALIADKMAAADWSKADGGASMFLKAAGLGLKATSKLLDNALGRLGKPVIRESMIKAMRSMGQQFVLGEDIQEAFVHATVFEKAGYRMSYDMLGEGARTQDDADMYFRSYRDAIRLTGQRLHAASPDMHKAHEVAGVSVKLSALHPRYEVAHREQCVPEMIERLLLLAKEAASYNVPLTVDAEEAARLPLSMAILEGVLKSDELPEWDGFGLAIQAYQKRALAVVDWVVDLANDHNRRLQVRLVKGAYWDSEIKWAQEAGLPDYPVYTRKSHSDVSYLTCAAQLLQQADMIYPMFGTHNAHTVAAIMDMAKSYKADFEFQSLYGMGQGLYSALMKEHDVKVALYAPVGPHKELLPYLVRRILENGANSSFVNQLLDEECDVNDLVSDPVARAKGHDLTPHPAIVMPADLYVDEGAEGRRNSQGLDFDDVAVLKKLYEGLEPYRNRSFEAASLVGGKMRKDGSAEVHFSPSDRTESIGKVWSARRALAAEAMDVAYGAFADWSRVDVEERASMLERTADLLEEHAAELMALLVREAGKTQHDAHLELREAVDFCRYYAAQGRADCSLEGTVLPGPTGEENIHMRRGRGAFVCISPWNFPLAIFVGQVAAALVAGNSVVAKPAEQTPIIAMRAVALLHEAGIPKDVLNLVIGDGFVGGTLVDHPLVAGVAFTGSTEVARGIAQSLATKRGGLVPLIAETGGQNAMLVDSSALPEQVIDDVVKSAFGSAGQRCSALRILCVQDDVAESVLRLLRGAMRELSVNDPWEISSDIGPIIDGEALSRLRGHCDALAGHGRLIHAVELSDELRNQGHFMGPKAYEIDQLSALDEEVFGPVLHVYRYKRKDLDYVIEQLNDMGYGLTLGIHSRVDSFVREVSDKMRAGNVYVNRSMIGAVVGSQPFGGQGLSGTGPKAGGPDYVRRFACERVVSTDTTATGGNASLVSLVE